MDSSVLSANKVLEAENYQEGKITRFSKQATVVLTFF